MNSSTSKNSQTTKIGSKYVLKASQDSKRAIKYLNNNNNNGCFTIYDIDNTKDIREIYSYTGADENETNKSRNLIDCAFFPSAFGVVIGMGYDNGDIEFIRENPDNSYSKIDCQIGGPDAEIDSNFELEMPAFEKNLRVSLSPPELNIGFISNSVICIFYVDFQTSLIKLIPIRRYDAPNTVWFDFTYNYSIWRCIFIGNMFKLENYDLNMFESKVKFDTDIKKIEDFVDASISPYQFDGTERIAVLDKKGSIDIFSSNKNANSNVDSHTHIDTKIQDPVSIEWSPFGARIAVFSSNQKATIFIATSSKDWESIEVQY